MKKEKKAGELRAKILECIRTSGEEGISVMEIATNVGTNGGNIVSALYAGDMIYEDNVWDENSHHHVTRLYWCGK